MAKTISLNDLRAKSDVDLAAFIKDTSKDLLDTRFQNYTNGLEDSSRIGKLRRDLARALTIKNERASKAASKQV
jgi:large subunit ribosomal protein L29